MIPLLDEQLPLKEREAQFQLSWLFLRGLGVTQDNARALMWLKKAANQELDLAQVGLGLMYLKGVGVTKNYEEAFRWFRRGAELGYPDAQGHLGIMYFKGDGTPRNNVEAYTWIKLASEKDSKYLRMFDKVTNALSPDELTEAKKLYVERANQLRSRQMP